MSWLVACFTWTLIAGALENKTLPRCLPFHADGGEKCGQHAITESFDCAVSCERCTHTSTYEWRETGGVNFGRCRCYADSNFTTLCQDTKFGVARASGASRYATPLAWAWLALVVFQILGH